MKRFVPLVTVGILAVVLGIAGCDSSYSSLVLYGVRTDPLMVAAQPGALGEDQYDPDRPGVFPIMKPEDVVQPDDPLSAKGDKLFADGTLRDPNGIPEADRKQIDQALLQLFGTPSEPKVGGLDAETVAKLGLDDASIKNGRDHYRIHCVHCHGVPGDGRGPTARWISPHPRDFRQGLFKFQSVDQTRGSTDLPPRREDLLHTLRYGVTGTAMPAFILLADKDLRDLVSYVIHLSLRGRAEFDTMAKSFEWKSDGKQTTAKFSDDGTIAEAVGIWHKLNAKKWVNSQDPANWIKVVPYNVGPGSAEAKVWGKHKTSDDRKALIKGDIAKALFNGVPATMPEAKEILELRGDKPAAVKCAQCHVDYGRQAKFKYDSWATLVRPNNFTLGVFRGGQRPIDIYHRIHSGINGSNMTAFGSAGTLSSNGIWDMVEFVQSLSYPAMRKKLGVELD